jgi:D-aminopeptidase
VDAGDGSIMIVVATDAPLSDRNLKRVAARAIMGLSRTGSSASNGSGDYVLAFSTSPSVRRRVVMGGQGQGGTSLQVRQVDDLSNDAMSALFQGVVEATEEAIYNSLFKATTVSSRGRTIEALPLDRLREILAKYGVTTR